MKLSLIFFIAFLGLGCASSFNLPAGSSTPEEQSKTHIESQLGVVHGEIMHIEGEINGAEARLLHYKLLDQPGKEGAVFDVELEIESLKARRMALDLKKQALAEQLQTVL